MLVEEIVRKLKTTLIPPSKDFTFELIPVNGYELVVKITNPKVGLKSFIAIHSLSLGPALGGTRVFPYTTEQEALQDVLRLAKGMTYKSAISEVGIGGGKSVIIASPDQKTPELLKAFGEAVEALQGKYIAAEDVGFTSEDALLVRKGTNKVVGLADGKSSGNPAPFTAWGTFRGMQSLVKKINGSNSLEGVKVAIQGLGNVGQFLVQYLFWEGAELVISDIDSEKAIEFAKKYGAEVRSSDEILFTQCDILAPCALGAVINDQTLPRLRCRAIGGCANNQLLRDDHAEVLRMREILYAPDYVINAGGLLNVVEEITEEGYSPIVPRKKAHQIYDTLLGIYEIAEKNNMSTVEAANALAEYRIQYGIGKRVKPPVFHHTA